MPRPRVILPLLFALLIAVLGPRPAVLVVGGTHPVQRSTPALPAAQTTPKPNWLPADKQGFGTSRTLTSKVWFTLEGGGLSEVYYPRLDTPSFRDLQFAVDGVPESGASVHQVTLADPSSLTYRQVNTDTHDGWRLTKTYVTDPSRSTVLIHVQLPVARRTAPPRGDPRRRRAVQRNRSHPAVLLSVGCARQRPADGDRARRPAGGQGRRVRRARRNRQLHDVDHAERATWSSACWRWRWASPATRGGALTAARASLRAGWDAVAQSYARGWHDYLSSLHKPPRSLATAAEGREYTVSQMVLAASEDKTYRGAFVASPTMPWAWGTGLQTPSGPYHLVWSRDLYEIATALIADGDTAGARRALHFLLFRQQEPDGSFPQNSDVTGKPALTNLQLDEVADPIILAWQLDAHDPATWQHVKLAADFIVGFHDDQGHSAPYTPQERWENQAGYSPATIASEIAGLVCAATIAQKRRRHRFRHQVPPDRRRLA